MNDIVSSCDDCDEIFTDCSICPFCQIKQCESCFKACIESNEAISRELFHMLDGRDFPPWDDFKKLTSQEPIMCCDCWLQKAGQILRVYRKKHRLPTCGSCQKNCPEIGLHHDNFGSFYRSDCYQCDPLHLSEVQVELSHVDSLLKHLSLI